MLPPEVLTQLRPEHVDQIIKSVDHEARTVQRHAWGSLVAGFVIGGFVLTTAWHYGDIGAPGYGAAIVGSGATFVGVFLGVRAWNRRRLGVGPEQAPPQA